MVSIKIVKQFPWAYSLIYPSVTKLYTLHSPSQHLVYSLPCLSYKDWEILDVQ